MGHKRRRREKLVGDFAYLTSVTKFGLIKAKKTNFSAVRGDLPFFAPILLLYFAPAHM